MQLDHIGIVVKCIEEGIKHWEMMFDYRQHTEIVINTRQKVKVVFLYKKDNLLVKLIEPVNETSPVWKFAKRGGGLHHLCFKTDVISNEIERMKNLGARLISPPQPGEAFENEDIAFVFAKHGMNIEIIETDKKANVIKEMGS